MAATKIKKPAAPPAISEEERDQIERLHTGSRANRIVALDVGDSLSESVRLDFDSSTRIDLDAAVASLKSAMSKDASRAMQRSGNEYVTEIGTFFTRSGAVMVCAVVTRVA